MSQLNEEFQALMGRVLAGSDEAARELFDNYAPYLIRAIRRRLGQRMRSKFDTQDFAQDVWASFFAEMPEKRVFADPEALVNFLTSLAQNKVIDAVRQRTQTLKRDIDREQSLDDPHLRKNEIIGDQATPSQLVISEDNWCAFLNRQPPVYRRILILLRAGKTRVEIAAEMGFHPRTVSRIVERVAPELCHEMR